MGEGCFLMHFPISPFVDLCLALPPSHNSLFGSPSLRLAWLWVFGPTTPARSLQRPAPPAPRAGRRPLSGCVGVPSLSLPRPLPDSGRSHLRGKVNI